MATSATAPRTPSPSPQGQHEPPEWPGPGSEPPRADELVPGVFDNRERAEEAIQALRASGLPEKALGLAVLDPGRYRLAEHSDSEAAAGVMRGIGIGVSLGSLAGIAVMAVAAPWLEVGQTLGLGGLLIGLEGGALWGAFLGGTGGLAMRVRMNADEDRWCEIPMGSGDILVVARAGEHAAHVRHIMQAHGARCFLEPTESVVSAA